MKILSACLSKMIARAREDAPNETCGFFSGSDVHPMRNVAAAPRTRYEFDATEHIKTIRRLEKENIPILGIYHSHVASEAYPSKTDVDRAILPDGQPWFPDYLYIIISLQNSSSPVARGFRIQNGGEIEEEELVIVDSTL